MIKPVEAKPGAGMTYDTSLSPAPAPTSPSESVAAPAEVGQVMGTLDGFQSFLARQNAAAHKDFLTLCAGLGDSSLPSEIAQQYEFMTLLHRCQDLIGNYLEQCA